MNYDNKRGQELKKCKTARVYCVLGRGGATPLLHCSLLHVLPFRTERWSPKYYIAYTQHLKSDPKLAGHLGTVNIFMCMCHFFKSHPSFVLENHGVTDMALAPKMLHLHPLGSTSFQTRTYSKEKSNDGIPPNYIWEFLFPP